MALPEVDDWVVPAQHNAPALGASDNGADDWAVPPPAPPSALERAHAAINRGPVHRVEQAVQQGMAEGIGSEPFGLSPETEQKLGEAGIFHEPGKGYTQPMQLINEAIIRPSAAGVDAFFRAIGAGASGLARGAGQVATEFGASQGSSEALTRDVQSMEDLALMSHIPERDMLHGALHGPAERPAAETARPPADMPTVQWEPTDHWQEVPTEPGAAQAIRAKVRDTPLDFKIENGKIYARKRPLNALPAPADATKPEQNATAAPADATAPAAGDYPSFEEPGRTAPPADDWAVPPPAPPTAQIPEEAKPPEPQPNAGPATFQQLLDDPRSAAEIKGSLDAAGIKGSLDAAGIAERQSAEAAAETGRAHAAAATPTNVPAGPIAERVQQLPDGLLTPRVIAAFEAQFEDQARAPGIAISLSNPALNRALVGAGLTDPNGLVNWAGLQALKAEAARRATIAPQSGQAPGATPVAPAVSHETTGSRESPIPLDTTAAVTAGAERTGVPTPGQAEAGNYRKRHLTWNGLDLTVETEAGMERKGTGPSGPWAVTLTNPYGYIKGTKGRDGDQVDVYVGPDPSSKRVFVVDQIDADTGRFDEHKALIGFHDEAAARAAYIAGFSDGRGNDRLGAIRSLTVEAFKEWLSKGQRRSPLAYNDPVRAAEGVASDLGLNAKPDEVEAAARAQKDNNTDLTDALVTVIEDKAIAEEADSAESIQHGRTPDTTAAHPVSAEPSPAGEPAQRAGEAQAGEAAPRVEPGQDQQPRRAERVEDQTPAGPGGAPSQQELHGVSDADIAAYNETVKKVRDRQFGEGQQPAEPELTKAATLTTADLQKLATAIPKMPTTQRDAVMQNIEEFRRRMAEDGRKIAEHCVETGGKFSVRRR